MTTKTEGGPGLALEKAAPSPGIVQYDEELARLAADHAGAGSDDATQADRATPFLSLLQGLSPQIEKGNAKFMKGAEVGDIVNALTGEIFKPEEGGILVVLAKFEKVYNVWIDRDSGGGFLGSYKDEACTIPIFVPAQDAPTDKPTQIIETANHYVLVQSKDGIWQPAIISMKVTQLKASRGWMTLVTMAQNKFATPKGPAPVFLRSYRITSASQKNVKGTFANYKIEDAGFATPALIRMAAEFRAAIEAGLLRADPRKSGDEPVAETPEPEAEGKAKF